MIMKSLYCTPFDADVFFLPNPNLNKNIDRKRSKKIQKTNNSPKY